MSEEEKEKAALIVFGRGGHTIHCYPRGHYTNIRIEGYDSPESLDLTKHEFAEGVPVLDLRNVSPRAVIAAPLCDTSLREGEEERFDEVVAGLSPTEKTAAKMITREVVRHSPHLAAVLAEAARPHEGPGPLDKVSVSAYVKWWAQVPNARVGRIEGGRIVWR
ncbi:MAG: hypothetical protein ACXQT3_06175 [Methermicoccaceae archaeon]